MGALTVVRTGPSRALKRTTALLPVWKPVPVMPTSWPALALMVERLTTGPDTQAKAAAAMRTPAAADPTPANAHLRTDFNAASWLNVSPLPDRATGPRLHRPGRAAALATRTDLL